MLIAVGTGHLGKNQLTNGQIPFWRKLAKQRPTGRIDQPGKSANWANRPTGQRLSGQIDLLGENRLGKVSYRKTEPEPSWNFTATTILQIHPDCKWRITCPVGICPLRFRQRGICPVGGFSQSVFPPAGLPPSYPCAHWNRLKVRQRKLSCFQRRKLDIRLRADVPDAASQQLKTAYSPLICRDVCVAVSSDMRCQLAGNALDECQPTSSCSWSQLVYILRPAPNDVHVSQVPHLPLMNI